MVAVHDMGLGGGPRAIGGTQSLPRKNEVFIHQRSESVIPILPFLIPREPMRNCPIMLGGVHSRVWLSD